VGHKSKLADDEKDGIIMLNLLLLTLLFQAKPFFKKPPIFKIV
jgi:hypothetical protein